MRKVIPITTATGMGPLPEHLEETSGKKAVRRAFQCADVPLALISDRSLRLPMAALVDLFHQAGRVSGDRLFGLRIGLAMRPANYGMWMEYALSAPTFRAATKRLAWSLPLHQTGPTLVLSERENSATWSYILPPFPGLDIAQHVDHVVPTMIQIARHYLGADWTPAWMGVPYPRDKAAAQLSDCLGVEWRFGEQGVTLPVSKDKLDLKRASECGAAQSAITRSDVLARIRAQDSSFAAIAAICIRLEMLRGCTNIDAVARRLETSTRTLQRDLAREGTSFNTALDRVRQVKAQELLCRPDTQIAEVAYALGYTDPSNFARAFRRWTGHAPHELKSDISPRRSMPRSG